MGAIQEIVFEDAISEQSHTEIIRLDQQDQGIRYGAERQAIGNQLELASMMSDHNSVMGSSPAKPSRVMSTRASRAKKADK